MTSDLLVPVLVRCLTDELRRKPYSGSSNSLAGHCYVASEAVFHLFKGTYYPCFVRHEGHPHWFLRSVKDNSVLDVTAGQFSTDVPYTLGVRKGFLTKQPSKRARIVMARYTEGVAHGLLAQSGRS